MPALTVKNIPDDLYTHLKESARVHQRSMNSEILYCVERTLVLRIPLLKDVKAIAFRAPSESF